MALASAVNQEEQRYVCEEFESNKELSLYDMLFRDEIIKEDIKDKKVHSKPVKENKKLIYHTQMCQILKEGEICMDWTRFDNHGRIK